MNANELVVYFTKQINKLIQFKNLDNSDLNVQESINQIEDKNLQKLFLAITELSTKLNDANSFVGALSKGKLDIEVPKRNLIISPFKELHANLTHLVWQVQRISEGDFNQEIDFLGDFSIYFNKLINFLREKEIIENELRISEEKLRTIIKISPEGISIVRMDGTVDYVSDKILEMHGYEKQEMLGRSMFDFLAPAYHQKAELLIEKMLDEHYSGSSEYEIIKKDGTHMFVDINSEFLKDKDGNPSFLFFVVHDITERKENELRLKELIQTKDKILSIIAHDLRNPFNAILGFSDLLLTNKNEYTNEQTSTFTQAINNSANNAYNLLENLLEWAMAQTGKIVFKPKKILLKALIVEATEVAESSAKNKNIAIINELNEDLEIYADRNMINTVMRNLISNAIKFTPKNGSIKIKANEQQDKVIISVIDTGIGISEEQIEKLFKIDEIESTIGTEHEHGTGLGLLLCKEFIERHKGKIWVESVLDKGSEFKFSITL